MAVNKKKIKSPNIDSKPQQPAKPIMGSVPKKDNGVITVLKEETLVWILTVLCSLIVYIVVANIIHSVYHPDVNVLMDEAKKILFDVNPVRPEPVESMLFRAGVVVIVLSLLGFYRLFSGMKAVRALAGTQVFTFLCFLCVAAIVALIWFDFAAQNPYAKDGGEIPQNVRDFHYDVVDNKAVDWGKSNFDFYFHGIFLGNYLLLYTFILVPLLSCLFFIGVKKFGWGENKVIKHGVTAICGVVILAIVAMNTYNFPYAYENKYDFNAVYYSMTQVHAGLPLLVHGFTNTYGLYPEFLNPLFDITGLSVLTFSFIMATLLGVAFAFNYFVLKWFTSNSFILLAGFLTVVFFPYLDFKFVTAFDSLFALFPIRYIIPSTLLLLSSIYFRKPSWLIYWTTFAIMGFFILWNPEIGMVSYLCWIAVNTYYDFYNSEGKIAMKKIAMHWLTAAGVVVAVVLLYKAVFYLVYGVSADMSLMFGTITLFGKVGYNMLPMVLVHPWNLSIIVLILGFTYAISKWYKKQVSAKAAIIFLLSLLGLGYFIYFQGRSHNWPFAYSTGFTLMLLTVLGDELWQEIKGHNLLPLSALFVVFLFVVSFSFFELLFGAGKMGDLISQEDDKSSQADEQARIESNIDFIQKNSGANDKIFVFSAVQYQGLYFGGSKRMDAFNPGLGELGLKTDLDRLTNTLADSAFSVFVEPALCTKLPFLVRPLAATAATYELKSINQTMALLTKRKAKVPAATYFADAPEMVVHRKYTDDTAGINARCRDAQGTKPIALSTAFSAEVLFKTVSQAFPYGTLMGNMNDSAGFIIANVVNTPNYFFGVNGKGFGVAMPANTWVYCVMNTFPDHIDVYVNGNLAGSTPLAMPLRQSPENFSFGNLGYLRYYIGAISEIGVLNKPLDKNDVAATWEKIKSGLGQN